MDEITLTHELAALAQVILIDITLAGDNAVVVGLAVAGLPAHQKRPAIIFGILGATVIRIALGAVALQLLGVQLRLRGDQPFEEPAQTRGALIGRHDLGATLSSANRGNTPESRRTAHSVGRCRPSTVRRKRPR